MKNDQSSAEEPNPELHFQIEHNSFGFEVVQVQIKAWDMIISYADKAW